MYKVKFQFQGQDNIIGCNSDDTMRQICNKFANMMNIDIDNIFFLYNSNIIDEEDFYLKFEEIIMKMIKLEKK